MTFALFHISSARLLQQFTPQFILAALLVLCGTFLAIGQERPVNPAAETVTIEGTKNGDVFGLGKSVLVRGTVTKGVIAFGGDVIVEGRVEGDVATIGGSVIQRENSFIGGDVIVFGGTYHHGKTAPLRKPNTETVIYAGYEDELRNAMQNPGQLFAPEFSAGFIGSRILAVLFWFVVSLILTGLLPSAVSSAITRLNLTRIRVAVIGSLSFLALAICGALGFGFLPTPVSVLIGMILSISLFAIYVYGRTIVQAATGKWLQKLAFAEKIRSESISLLLGAIFWTLILSLPFIWAFAFVGLLIVSLGIALTARPSLPSR